jgi:hypothetical protein
MPPISLTPSPPQVVAMGVALFFYVLFYFKLITGQKNLCMLILFVIGSWPEEDGLGRKTAQEYWLK